MKRNHQQTSLFECCDCHAKFTTEKIVVEHSGEETYYMCPNCNSENYKAINQNGDTQIQDRADSVSPNKSSV